MNRVLVLLAGVGVATIIIAAVSRPASPAEATHPFVPYELWHEVVTSGNVTLYYQVCRWQPWSGQDVEPPQWQEAAELWGNALWPVGTSNLGIQILRGSPGSMCANISSVRVVWTSTNSDTCTFLPGDTEVVACETNFSTDSMECSGVFCLPLLADCQSDRGRPFMAIGSAQIGFTSYYEGSYANPPDPPMPLPDGWRQAWASREFGQMLGLSVEGWEGGRFTPVLKCGGTLQQQVATIYNCDTFPASVMGSMPADFLNNQPCHTDPTPQDAAAVWCRVYSKNCFGPPFAASVSTSHVVLCDAATATDTDGDGLGDLCDPDSAEPDPDLDGWKDSPEIYMGTDPLLNCNATTTANDEDPDAWPPDFNDDGSVNIIDIGAMRPAFNKAIGEQGYDPRLDLNADGRINIVDQGFLSPVFNQTCAAYTAQIAACQPPCYVYGGTVNLSQAFCEVKYLERTKYGEAGVFGVPGEIFQIVVYDFYYYNGEGVFSFQNPPGSFVELYQEPLTYSNLRSSADWADYTYSKATAAATANFKETSYDGVTMWQGDYSVHADLFADGSCVGRFSSP